MANYFVDSTTGSDSDNGTTMDLAWATLEYGAAQATNAGDIIWVRRLHNETPIASVKPGSGGQISEAFRSIIGWPRNSSNITSATWTQGSTTVDSIVGVTPIRRQHLGRFVTGPDGYDYLITKLVSIGQGDNCKLLLHCDEASFTDSSGESHAVTMGDTVRSATESVFSGYAAYFNGTSADLQLGDHADWDFSSGTYTIDLWFWPVDGVGNQEIVTTRNGQANVDGLALLDTNGSLKYYLSSDGSNWDIASAVVIGVPNTGEWNHLRFTYDGVTYRGYLNGIEGNPTVSGTSVIDTSTLTFGSSLDGNYFEGYMDEIIIQREAIGSGDGNFSVPTTPYAATSAVIIDRPYINTTVSGVSGAATIKADEYYATAQAIDDSGWTIKKSNYNSDSDDLPLIDFGVTTYSFWIDNIRRWYIAGLDLQGGDWSGYGSFLIAGSGSNQIFVQGVLMHQDNNEYNLYLGGSGTTWFDRCIFTAEGGGSAQFGPNIQARGFFTNCASYGQQRSHIYLSNGGELYMDNMNLGVEIVGHDVSDFYSGGGGRSMRCWGRDVKFGNNLDEVVAAYIDAGPVVDIENYNKVLGAHKRWHSQGTTIKKDVSVGSGDPERRSAGASSVIQLAYNENALAFFAANPLARFLTNEVFMHEFEATTTSKSYRYYVQAEGSVTADELYIVCEYVSAYEGSSEYAWTTVQSDEAITVRTGADDWSQYIEVTGIQPAVVSKVRITCYCTYYHATNQIYIDPLAVIT